MKMKQPIAIFLAVLILRSLNPAGLREPTLFDSHSNMAWEVNQNMKTFSLVLCLFEFTDVIIFIHTQFKGEK